MNTPRVLFYVQYLEGIGHVVRAQRIAEALLERGMDVALVLGGMPIPGLQLVGGRIRQLPPLKAGPDSYSKLLTEAGQPADDDYKNARREQLLDIYANERPNVLLTEAYPMGRWAMHFELEPLLAQANTDNPRPMILASLRDILQMPKSADKADKSVALYKTFYDGMLVHGDPALVRVEESFPPLARFLDEAHYTGMVTPVADTAKIATGDAFDVIVSGGGGAIGYDVLAAAFAAKPLSCMADTRWLALSGPRMTDAEFARLRELATVNNVRLERFRADLAGLMAHAELSIQRAGYNTVADMLVANCRGVLVPDGDGGQMEQPLRAEKLEALGRAVVVPEAALSANSMATAIDRAMKTNPSEVQLDFDGAARSAEMIRDLFARYQATENAV